MKVLFDKIGLLGLRATVLAGLYTAGHFLLEQETPEFIRIYQAWILAFSLFAIYEFVFKRER